MAQSDNKTILLGYQKRWVEDKSPLKLWRKARQIGFSFAASYGCVVDCLRRKALWIFLSRGQRQAKELARKAKEHCQALAKVERAAAGVQLLEDQPFGFFEGTEILQEELRFPNDARIIALPANADTARGYTGNVLLDEFAFHRDAKAIYAAVYPFITRGFRLEIGSSPFGESGAFYELDTKATGFSKHVTTIYDAVADGLKVDIDLLRSGCPDQDIWLQEYECKYISDATAWIPWEWILAAESLEPLVVDIGREESRAPKEIVREALAALSVAPGALLYLGGDVGRKRDLTVDWLLAYYPTLKAFHSPLVVRMRGRKFSEQREVAELLMDRCDVRRLCQDSTGLGAQLAEELQDKYGESRVEPIVFSSPVKEDLAVRTRRAFEDRAVKLPDHREIRVAMHAVRKYPTAAGHFRFDAERTEAGHADDFWALSLALLAAAGPGISIDHVASQVSQAHALTGGYL